MFRVNGVARGCGVGAEIAVRAWFTLRGRLKDIKLLKRTHLTIRIEHVARFCVLHVFCEQSWVLGARACMWCVLSVLSVQCLCCLCAVCTALYLR